MLGKNLQQPGHLIQFVDLGNIAHISLHNGPDVVACPCLAPLRLFAPQHLRVTASQYGSHKISADQGLAGFAELSLERGFQEHRLAAANLRLRKREQIDDFHAAGQTLRDLGNGEKISRPRQEESARPAILIHGPFYGSEKIGRSLNFVNRSLVQPAYQPGRIAASRCQSGFVVHGEELALPRDQIADQRSLAALTRTGYQDDRRVLERSLDDGSRKAGVKRVFEVGHFGIYFRPIRIIRSSNSDYTLVQSGLNHRPIRNIRPPKSENVLFENVGSKARHLSSLATHLPPVSVALTAPIPNHLSLPRHEKSLRSPFLCAALSPLVRRSWHPFCCGPGQVRSQPSTGCEGPERAGRGFVEKDDARREGRAVGAIFGRVCHRP